MTETNQPPAVARLRLLMYDIANDRGDSRRERPHADVRCRVCAHVVGVIFRVGDHVLLGRLGKGFTVDEFDLVLPGRFEHTNEQVAFQKATSPLASLSCHRHGPRPVHALRDEIRRSHRSGRIRRTIKI